VEFFTAICASIKLKKLLLKSIFVSEGGNERKLEEEGGLI
jgi:hypothetical protein